MKTAGLSNTTVDRRRLTAQDRAQYQPRNRARQVARARLNRGNLAYSRNATVGRQEMKPGSGGYNPAGIQTQQQRMRDQSAELERSRALRPTSI